VLFGILQFLHVLTMFAAVAAATMPELLLHRVGRSGDVEAIRTFSRLTQPLNKLIPLLFVVGLIFGLLAAWAGSIDFFRPWLLAAYVVFVIAMAVGGTMSGPWAERVGAAAFASGTDAPSAELAAAIHDRRGIVSTVVLMTALVVIVFLMVVKPGN
jgi:hypothetical protein